MTFTLRIHPSGERAGPSREERYPTKRELFSAITKLGQLGLIQKVAPRTYSVRQKPKK